MAAEGRRPRAVVSWSTGKDAAWALAEVRRTGALDVVGLLATVTTPFDRVAMHGVRRSILVRQASLLGLPLMTVEIPYPCPNAAYEAAMARATRALRASGVERIVFGDLFLADVRRYREEQLRGTGLEPEFPLWGRPTRALAEAMVAGGLRATIAVVDPRVLPARFAGRAFDAGLLEELPPGVDPCGERGEFHTVVTEGPFWPGRLALAAGPTVERDGFVFADVRLEDEPP